MDFCGVGNILRWIYLRRWIPSAVNICGGGYCASGVRGGCWTLAIKGGVRDIVCAGGVLDCCNQKGGCAISCVRGGAGLLQSKEGCAISSAGGCWTLAIKGGGDIVCAGGVIKGGCEISSARGGAGTAAIKRGLRDIVCAGRVLDPCNQSWGARSRLRGGAGLLQSKGGARYRLRGGGAGLLQSKGGCAISSAWGGRGTAKGGVCDIVCTAAAIKEGWVRDIVCAGVLDCCNQRGGARYRLRGGVLELLQSNGGCAISSARGGCWTLAIKAGVREAVCAGVLDCCNQKEGVRYRLRGGGAGLLQLNGGFAISSPRLLQSKEDGCAISSARGCWTLAIKGGCAISSARGCWTAAIKRGGGDIVCAGKMLKGGVCAGGRAGPLQSKGGVRDIVCAGVLDCCDQRGVRDIVCAGGAGLLKKKGGCAISSAWGGAGPLQSKGGCAISSARLLQLKGGGVRDIVCARGAGPLQSKGKCAISSARWGGLLQSKVGRYRLPPRLQSKGGCAISSARGG